MGGLHNIYPLANTVESVRYSHDPGESNAMSKLLILAIFLVILWVVLRVALAITGVFLHLLWIIAIILAVLWLIGKLRGSK
jgi:type IV secretory pathway TrbL component